MTIATQYEHILGFFDGDWRKMCEICGYQQHQTRYWARSGRIPQDEHLNIIVKARAAGIIINPTEFSAHLVELLIQHIQGADSVLLGA